MEGFEFGFIGEGARGDDWHRIEGFIAACGPEGLQEVLGRQIAVDDHEVRLFATGDGEPVPAFAGDENAVAIMPEKLKKELLMQRVILDDENCSHKPTQLFVFVSWALNESIRAIS